MKTGHSGDRPPSSSVTHSVSAYLRQKLQSINSHLGGGHKLDEEPVRSGGAGRCSKSGSSAASCGHAAALEGSCADCGEALGNRGGPDFGYLVEGLRLSAAEVAGYRESSNLADAKKLCLVLDLDNTLVDSILVSHLAPGEQEQRSLDAVATASNGTLFVLQDLPLVTKLRPFVREFLWRAGDMFEMYVYTMGNREYASTVVHLLDPEGAYFGSRVISREFSTSSTYKSLDLVLAPESAVLILDDTEEVWPDHRKNLIPVPGYKYFDFEISPEDGVDWGAYAQAKIDEEEDGGVLSSVLSVLKDVHGEFFDRPEHGAKGRDKRDVRKVLARARSRVLKSCVLSFSEIVGSGSESGRLRAAAEELGAKCKAGHGSSVTHVVAVDLEEESSRWAKREGKKLVSPDWLWAAYYHWRRKPEDEFSLSSETQN